MQDDTFEENLNHKKSFQNDIKKSVKIKENRSSQRKATKNQQINFKRFI